jgi:hypothetical protein
MVLKFPSGQWIPEAMTQEKRFGLHFENVQREKFVCHGWEQTYPTTQTFILIETN